MYSVPRRTVLAAAATVLAARVTKAQPASGPTIIVSGTKLLNNNQEYRAIGCNFYDALHHDDMAQRFTFLKANGIPFIRLDFGVYSVGNASDQGWRQYLTDKRAWYALRDRCVEAAEASNLGLVATMFWHPYTLPRLMEYAYGKEESLADWGRPESNTRHFMRDVVAEIAERYKNSPSIWGWECGNEFSNEVILGCNQPVRYTLNNSRLTFDQLSDAYSEWAAVVRSVDSSSRLLSSGDNLADHNMFGCATDSRLDPDTLSEWMNIPTRGRHAPGPIVLNPADLNSISTHIYQHANVPGQWFKGGPQMGPAGLVALHKRIADEYNRVVFIGEFGSLKGRYGQDGKNGTDGSKEAERRYYEATLEAIIASKIQLAAAWNYAYQPTTSTKDWNIDPGSDREYVFRSIVDANARIARDLGSPAPDRMAQEGVVKWAGGEQIRCRQGSCRMVDQAA